MADHKSKLFLICYDIADPKRLGRVHRYLKRRGLPVQYSVFIARGPRAKLLDIMYGLGQLIDPRDDDVRAYTLPERCEAVTLGRQLLPDEVTLVNHRGELASFKG